MRREVGGKENKETREQGRDSTYEECIYALKETIWLVLFLPLERKNTFGILKNTFSFPFSFDLILFQDRNSIM